MIMIYLQLTKIRLHILNVNIACVVCVCIYGPSAEIVIFVSSDLIKGAAVCGLCLTSSGDLLIRNGFRRSTNSRSADMIYLILRGDIMSSCPGFVCKGWDNCEYHECYPNCYNGDCEFCSYFVDNLCEQGLSIIHTKYDEYLFIDHD